MIPPAPPQGARESAHPWTRRALPFGVGLAVLALLALLTWGLGRQRETVGLARVYVREVPSFQLPLFAGGTLSSAELRGTPTVINFWASWCVPCAVEAPVLEAAARKYGQRVVFLGIDVQDTEADARRFLQRYGISYRNGQDASGEIAIAFGMTGVPETYFVDREGRITQKWNGALTAQSIDNLLKAVLSPES